VEAGVDDAYLVRRAQEGYLDAYAELVDRYSGLAYRVALRVVGNHHDAEDVAQEALVGAWQQLPNFRAQSTFSTCCTGSSRTGPSTGCSASTRATHLTLSVMSLTPVPVRQSGWNAI